MDTLTRLRKHATNNRATAHNIMQRAIELFRNAPLVSGREALAVDAMATFRDASKLVEEVDLASDAVRDFTDPRQAKESLDKFQWRTELLLDTNDRQLENLGKRIAQQEEV